MNRKKIIIIISVVLLLFFLIILAIKNISIEKDPLHSEKNMEYTPSEEINTEQLRKTVLNLYFIDKETKNLQSEGKLIDSINLLEDPYKFIVQNLIDGPASNNLESVFPENTRIVESSFNNNCVTLNFSEELLNYSNEDQKYNIINSLLNTLSQLTEVNSIKILINGESSQDFNEEYSAIY